MKQKNYLHKIPEDYFGTPTWPRFFVLEHQHGCRDVVRKRSTDNILIEVLHRLVLHRIGNVIITKHLITLFNRTLSIGKLPLLWSFGLIVPIHKKDDRSGGITLLSSISKFFTSILKMTIDCYSLYDYEIQKGILKA